MSMSVAKPVGGGESESSEPATRVKNRIIKIRRRRRRKKKKGVEKQSTIQTRKDNRNILQKKRKTQVQRSRWQTDAWAVSKY